MHARARKFDIFITKYRTASNKMDGQHPHHFNPFDILLPSPITEVAVQKGASSSRVSGQLAKGNNLSHLDSKEYSSK